MKFLNIGCGSTYVCSPDWLNIDLNGNGVEVLRLSVGDLVCDRFKGRFSAVYCSHLIEHLDINETHALFNQVSVLLKPGGVFRVVTPDFDDIVSKYCFHVETGDLVLADFEKTLLLEQCVRTVRSGVYRKLIESFQLKKNDFSHYLIGRTGYPTKGVAPSRSKRTVCELCKKEIDRVRKRLCRSTLRFAKKLLPSYLKDNVLLVDPGERHKWMFSLYELERIGKSAGFIQCESVSPSTSMILSTEDLTVLDGTDELPRKGSHSMFVEFRSAEIDRDVLEHCR